MKKIYFLLILCCLFLACEEDVLDPEEASGEPSSHVTNFSAAALSEASIEVSWVDVEDASNYLLMAKTASGIYPDVSDGVMIAEDTDWSDNNSAINVSKGTMSKTIAGLMASTSYEFMIYPYNKGGDPDPDYKTDGNVPTTNATTKSEAGPGFNESLVMVNPIDVSGTPFDITTDIIAYMSHPQKFINWSYIPRIVMLQNPSDNGYSIAWYDETNSTIKITSFNGDDVKIGSDISIGTGVHALGGFDKKGSDFVVGYITGSNMELFNVAIVSGTGDVLSTTSLTGTTGLEDLHSKQSPLDFGSSRIVVNRNTEKIGAYLSHKMKWDDGIKHQGAMIKILDYSGNILGGDVLPYADDAAGGDGWFWSHNFDTRMQVSGNQIVLVGNGDNDPRAIALRLIDSSTGSYTENTSLFPISGDLGDNDTKSQLGGFTLLDDNSYALTFSTEEGKAARNVLFIHVGADGSEISRKWITDYTSKDMGYAINVKSAKYGSDILLAWEEVTDAASSEFKSKFAVIDLNGEFISGPTEFSNLRFNRGDDFINYSNGDVGWTIGSGQQLKVYRLKYSDLDG